MEGAAGAGALHVMALQAALAAKPGAVCAPLPSAPGVLIYKVMDKMFAILEIRRIQAVILKCDPSLASATAVTSIGVTGFA